MTSGLSTDRSGGLSRRSASGQPCRHAHRVVPPPAGRPPSPAGRAGRPRADALRLRPDREPGGLLPARQAQPHRADDAHRPAGRRPGHRGGDGPGRAGAGARVARWRWRRASRGLHRRRRRRPDAAPPRPGGRAVPRLPPPGRRGARRLAGARRTVVVLPLRGPDLLPRRRDATRRRADSSPGARRGRAGARRPGGARLAG